MKLQDNSAFEGVCVIPGAAAKLLISKGVIKRPSGGIRLAHFEEHRTAKY